MELNYGRIIKKDGILGMIVKEDKNELRFLPIGKGSYFIEQLDIITENDIEDSTKQDMIEHIKCTLENSGHSGTVNNIYEFGKYFIFECRHKTKENLKSYFVFYVNMQEHTYAHTLDLYETLEEAKVGMRDHELMLQRIEDHDLRAIYR